MRGLDIRVDYVMAKINALVAPEADGCMSDDMYYALLDAEVLGISDYEDGIFDVPTMFADEPALVREWKYGRRFAAENESMSVCNHCNDGTGNPCPVHG